MSPERGSAESPSRTPADAGPATGRRHETLVLARTALIACVLIAAYYLLPFDREFGVRTVVELVVGLLVVVALVLLHVRQTLRSPRPGLRATGALLTTVPLFVLLFSSVYFVLAHSVPASFGQPLTRTDALYFTVTVLGTVGFGDIAAHTQVARLLTTAQIALDFVFIGVAVRILLGTARVAFSRQLGESGAPVSPVVPVVPVTPEASGALGAAEPANPAGTAPERPEPPGTSGRSGTSGPSGDPADEELPDGEP